MRSNKNWVGLDAAPRAALNGSMKVSLMLLAADHIRECFRCSALLNKLLALLLRGRSNGNGPFRLLQGPERSVGSIQAPSLRLTDSVNRIPFLAAFQ